MSQILSSAAVMIGALRVSVFYRDSMLCLYHKKTDSKPQHFLSMGGDHCVGCKRDFNSDRNHSIRVMLADGTHWGISLATEMEANDWIQALCQAISDGLKVF